MKVLTLHQPWASLVALGVKTIETRSWSTKYRGPLAIHAGSRQVHHGQFFMLACTARTRCQIDMEAEHNFRSLNVPFGAIVATCTLVDVVPIGRWGIERETGKSHVGDFPHDGPLPHQAGGLWLIGTNGLTRGSPTRIEDQRPYGDFTPGRFAWLLAEVKPVDPPISFKGGQGLSKTWEVV